MEIIEREKYNGYWSETKDIKDDAIEAIIIIFSVYRFEFAFNFSSSFSISVYYSHYFIVILVHKIMWNKEDEIQNNYDHI